MTVYAVILVSSVVLRMSLFRDRRLPSHGRSWVNTHTHLSSLTNIKWINIAQWNVVFSQ